MREQSSLLCEGLMQADSGCAAGKECYPVSFAFFVANPGRWRGYENLSPEAVENKLASHKAWKRSDRGRSSCRRWQRKYRWENKLACLAAAAYGGTPPRCSCCGEGNLGFLTIDHVNNDGKKHRASIMPEGGSSFYIKLARLGFPQDPPLIVLCYNCNCGRQKNGGICPHKSTRKLAPHDKKVPEPGRPDYSASDPNQPPLPFNQEEGGS